MTFKSKVFAGLSSLWAIFIFSNSIKPGDLSEDMSSPIVKTICGWFSDLGMQLNLDVTTLVVRKTAHFTEFFILGLLISICFSSLQKRMSQYTGTILFLCLFSGVVDEFIQSFVVGRSADVRDVVIDFAGGLLAFIIVAIVTKVKAKKQYKKRRFR